MSKLYEPCPICGKRPDHIATESRCPGCGDKRFVETGMTSRQLENLLYALKRFIRLEVRCDPETGCYYFGRFQSEDLELVVEQVVSRYAGSRDL